MANNHGYNTPSAGTSDWDIPLNENFELLDRDVEIRDTETNLGNYEAKSGAKFLATDTGNVYIGDGTDWLKLDSRGQDPSFNSVNAANLTVGEATGRSGYFANRPLVSNGDISVDVPGDYDTIQAALEDVPVLLRHRYSIQLDPDQGLYDEDIIVPPVYSMDMNSTSTGINAGLYIYGAGQSSGYSKIGSALVINPTGYFSVRLDNLDFTRDSPYHDDSAAIGVYGGSGMTFLSTCRITDGSNITQGLIAYGARVAISGFSFGSTSVDYGLRAKRGGYVYVRTGVTGSGPTLYACSGGTVEVNGDSDTGAENFQLARGYCVDCVNGIIYFPGGRTLEAT